MPSLWSEFLKGLHHGESDCSNHPGNSKTGNIGYLRCRDCSMRDRRDHSPDMVSGLSSSLYYLVVRGADCNAYQGKERCLTGEIISANY